MRFALASYGSRGDVEPCAAVGRELLRRGHEVRMAVPPHMLGFVESVGLAAVACGPDAVLGDADVARFSAVHDPISALNEYVEYATQMWAEMGATLRSLADGADLILTGMSEKQGLAANVAEYHDIPLAVLHSFPAPEFNPTAPPMLSWLDSHITKVAEDAQRRTLGLPAGTTVKPGPLQIQAYDELCFPGLAAQWRDERPFVGALTLQLPTDADEEVLSWIAAGTPPIYFGFGSTPIAAAAEVLATISAACAQLGERALIYPGTTELSPVPHLDGVKVVGAVNYAAVLPACRAVVHHGGAGTTAAGLRAGVPALILWVGHDQPIWAAAVERLNVGAARPLAATSYESLVADLRSILVPGYTARAREVANRMTKPDHSVAAAADLLEETARRGRVA